MSGYDLRAIVLSLHQLDEEYVKEQLRHQNEDARIEVARNALQEKCSHPLTDYYPDASGNNDDMTQCQICRKQW